MVQAAGHCINCIQKQLFGATIAEVIMLASHADISHTIVTEIHKTTYINIVNIYYIFHFKYILAKYFFFTFILGR